MTAPPLSRRTFLGNVAKAGMVAAAAPMMVPRQVLSELGTRAGPTRAQTVAQAGTTTTVSAWHLTLEVKDTGHGIHLQSLYDTLSGRELLAERPGPLWDIALFDPQAGEWAFQRADQGWKDTQVRRQGEAAELRWHGAQDERFAGVNVIARVDPRAPDDALHWSLEVNNESDWAVYEMAFPQVGLREMPAGKLFYPADEGKLDPDPWNGFETRLSNYPGHFVQLQYYAVYEPGGTGLYFGRHDPEANTKQSIARADAGAEGLRLQFWEPAPDMVVAGNAFEMDGEAVWRLFEGDWYDAAMIYRAWAMQQKWYPKLGPNGREDTPQWAKELPTWIKFWTEIGSWTNKAADPETTIKAAIQKVKEYAEFMDVPVGAHWYVWFPHPHDNNYPDFFPPKEGFADAVTELQKAGVRVMPYINVRLWDTALDSFSTTGRPGACKAVDGAPFTIHQPNGPRPDTTFATMDPSTEVWQDKVRELTLKLFDAYGVDAVYLDQLGGPGFVRADQPEGYPRPARREFGAPAPLCYDPEHGHPLGGGHWWTSGYREMTKRIREEMPEEGILTCEHAPEMYTDQLDGVLVWTWGRGYDNDDHRVVPAVVAVYGGAVQFIGRNFGGAINSNRVNTKYVPMVRHVTAMMLVQGNQIGWWPPRIVDYKPLARYVRCTIHLRYALSRYFSGGRFMRPLDLEVPAVTYARTRWYGGGTGASEAVLTSAWKLPEEGRVALLFVNWTEEAVATDVEIDLEPYGMDGQVAVRKIGPKGPTGEVFTATGEISREVTFEPKAAWAWELTSSN